MTKAQCRFCKTDLKHSFVDLGMSPLSNSYLKAEQLNQSEKFYPLHTYVCSKCLLIQLEEFESPDHIFSDYAYFSSYSNSWLKHCQQYTNLMIEKFSLSQSSQVIEIASNDGYLLQYFHNQQIPVLGIEPAVNVAKVAIAKGINTTVKFFGVATAQELVSQAQQADLLLGNNVLAHVPDINDFVAGMQIALKPDGVITMEFPHLLQLINQNQFDTIYHEHFSYLSLIAVSQIFAAHDLTIFDVEELPTHGGSLRIYAKHHDNHQLTISDRLIALQEKEKDAGLDQVQTYLKFSEQVIASKHKLLSFLIDIKRSGKTIVGYGAPAKGNTLLNYCGIRGDFLDYTCDRSPHKQGLFLPGTHIPIYAPEQIQVTKPDYVLILPWNLKEEIQEQLAYIRQWDGKFIVPIPEVEVLE
ncbi:class I SAM-dependent methyltransferase [Pseudanabaena yagii]|uniref:Class I SAM-dependent methyltransferase n=1 Tax=Pseudanabaena yagii GIHE-NHR1 TaxID=2722753 RepID=A0ABX1LXU6_9CYAN|nr:class I SAM-dependent methyltransferase [Pseudanabaena yagii]NMF60994.1 class I SAM-dependent methyltransferase [Pseudanabaena yagii GIHE-NHR1]